jgi:hypothetical protein
MVVDRTRSGSLSSGSGYTGTFASALPGGLNGNYYVFVSADHADAVYEYTNAASNIARTVGQISIAQNPFADLVVETVAGTNIASVGEPVLLRWTVRNTLNAFGVTPVASWTDRIVLSADGTLGNGDDQVLGNFAHNGALNRGDSYTNSATVTLPMDMSGSLTLFITTDAANTVYEFNYENNNASTPLAINIRVPDLAISPPANSRDRQRRRIDRNSLLRYEQGAGHGVWRLERSPLLVHQQLDIRRQ